MTCVNTLEESWVQKRSLITENIRHPPSVYVHKYIVQGNMKHIKRGKNNKGNIVWLVSGFWFLLWGHKMGIFLLYSLLISSPRDGTLCARAFDMRDTSMKIHFMYEKYQSTAPLILANYHKRPQRWRMKRILNIK